MLKGIALEHLPARASPGCSRRPRLQMRQVSPGSKQAWEPRILVKENLVQGGLKSPYKEVEVIPIKIFGGAMSDYSVLISVNYLTKKEIRHKLRTAFGTSVSIEAVISKSGSLAACHKTCMSAAHFGCVHWTDEDLQSKFKQLGVPATEKILNLVRSSYVLRHIDDSMVRIGWEVIEQAIVDAQRLTRAKKHPSTKTATRSLGK